MTGSFTRLGTRPSILMLGNSRTNNKSESYFEVKHLNRIIDKKSVFTE